jgi:hypothetical protein
MIFISLPDFHLYNSVRFFLRSFSNIFRSRSARMVFFCRLFIRNSCRPIVALLIYVCALFIFFVYGQQSHAAAAHKIIYVFQLT